MNQNIGTFVTGQAVDFVEIDFIRDITAPTGRLRDRRARVARGAKMRA